METEKNNIYIYPSGVVVFSSQVTVKYGDDINKIKHELEVKVKKIIQDNFKIQGSQIKLDKFNKSIKYGNRFKLVDVFNLESARVSSPAWTHKIYWFYGNEFSEYDETKGEQKLKSSLVQDFTGLLEQSPENTLFLQDRFIFYGWGRSLILTDKSDQSTKEWVRNKVNLVEIGQYSCFGHILLDYLMKRVISKLTVEEPIIAQSAKDLEHGTELIDYVRPPATVFLEEYRAGINAILHAGAPFLVKTLEDQWRLSKVEESIKNKLESLNNERSAIEQSTIMQKQDRMNIISSSFTIMGIASVTAAIVALSPLNKWLEEEKSLLPFLSINQVIFFILTTIIIIGLTITIIFKWHDIKRWISHKITSWNYVHKYRNKIKSLDPETIKKEELGLVKREVKNAFNRGKINKSQYYRLQNEIEKAYGT